MDGISVAEWNGLARQGDPFVSHEFLAGAERWGVATPQHGWYPRHIIVRDVTGELIGGMPLYRRTLSFGDYSYDKNWLEAFANQGQAYLPKLVTGVPFTPASGPRFLSKPGSDRLAVVQALVRAGLSCLKTQNASSWQCLFVDPDEAVRTILTEAGFQWRRSCQFRWINQGYGDFADFLATLTAERRYVIRRDRRLVTESGLRLATFYGDEVSEQLWAQLFPLYLATYDKYENRPGLTQQFFLQTGRLLAKNMVVFVAFDNEIPVATSICYRSGDVLVARNWGADAFYPSLYFELCLYQGIEYCIRHNLRRFDPGAGGEHKVSRGFAPSDTWSAYWIAHPGVRRGMGEFFKEEDRLITAYQQKMAQRLPFKN